MWSTHTKGTAYDVFEILDVKSFSRQLRFEWSPRLPDPLHCQDASTRPLKERLTQPTYHAAVMCALADDRRATCALRSPVAYLREALASAGQLVSVSTMIGSMDHWGPLKPARPDESVTEYKRRMAKTRSAFVYARGKRLVVASQSYKLGWRHNGAYWSLIIPCELETLGITVLDALLLSGKKPSVGEVGRDFWDRLGPSPENRLITDTKLVMVNQVDKITVTGTNKIRGGWEAISPAVDLPDRDPRNLGWAIRDAFPAVITRRWPVEL